ncbi:uncharacterized protein LOC117100769 [Anneissia japonica]|uniref:uncharacterized protein LOC117100769 n=1 Tax=Anneissia japonica TaxID=1529436 RepID=UPI00142592BD|nr:uncharacterized protein LOC117100769 [Anneissia japonica]
MSVPEKTTTACFNGGYWDFTNKRCRCNEGWTGITCSESCNKGSYGINCFNVCRCGQHANCDVFTGQCTCPENRSNCVECKAGLYGPACSIPCICESGVCHTNGVCISDGSTTLGATAIAAISFGVILSVMLILILILLCALWRRKPLTKVSQSLTLNREQGATDVDDTFNDFDIVYEVGSGRNSIDTDVGSITSSTKMYPTRVVQQRELPGIPEEDEEAGKFVNIANEEESNAMDRVDNWGFKEPPNRTDSVSSSVLAVHGSVRAKVEIHDESEPTNAAMNSLNGSSNALNIEVDSNCRLDNNIERALLSDDYMELRKSIENLTAAIAHIPLVVSQGGGSSGNVSQVGNTDSSSDHSEQRLMNVPSIKVSDDDEEVCTSGSGNEERIKRKKKRKSVHNYLAINTGNAPSSSDDDDDDEVFNGTRTAFNMDSGNESDSRGYNKVDRTKRSYSREIVDANDYASLQLVDASPPMHNKIYLAPNSKHSNYSKPYELTEIPLVSETDNANERLLANESEQHTAADDQYLETKINDIKINDKTDTHYLETIPIVNEPSDSVNKLKEIEKSANSYTEVNKPNVYDNKLGLILKQESSETPDSSLFQTMPVVESKIRQLQKPFMKQAFRENTQMSQPIAVPIKSKIPVRITKQFTI